MSQITFSTKVNYIWSASRLRIAALLASLAGLYFLQDVIPDFTQKITFTVESMYAAAIAFGVAVVGLLAFSLLLNILIRFFKMKIDFHPDDYNVSSGVTAAVTTPGLRLPFAVSGLIINPFGEELFFRMLIIGYFSTVIGPAYASLISVIAYCLLARKTKEIMEFLIIAVIGFICSYLYLQFSIWYSFAANGGFVFGIYATSTVFNYLDSRNSVA